MRFGIKIIISKGLDPEGAGRGNPYEVSEVSATPEGVLRVLISFDFALLNASI